MYDITDTESFTKVQKWVRELRRIVGDGIAIAIAGNKIDLEKQRTVDQAEAAAYASSVGAEHFHTSAKINRGLDEVFLHLARKIVAQAQAQNDQLRIASPGDASLDTADRRNIVLVDDTQAPRGTGHQAGDSGQPGCCS